MLTPAAWLTGASLLIPIFILMGIELLRNHRKTVPLTELPEKFHPGTLTMTNPGVDLPTSPNGVIGRDDEGNVTHTVSNPQRDDFMWFVEQIKKQDAAPEIHMTYGDVVPTEDDICEFEASVAEITGRDDIFFSYRKKQ